MRFFFLAEPPDSLEGSWPPPPELLKHLRALRLTPEENFLLLLPQGGALRCHWPGKQEIQLAGLCELPRLPLLPVTLATAWPKGARADQLVIRATEAGVERILPLVCERSVAGRTTFSANRRQRWKRLILETCEQSGRPVLPSLAENPIFLQALLDECPLATPIALHPHNWPLATELDLRPPREVLLIVGPEGGFSANELTWLREQGVQFAGLLPTVLRVEAAGPAAVTVCQHWFYQLQAS